MQETKREQESGGEIRELLDAVVKGKWLVVGATLLVTALSAGWTIFREKDYGDSVLTFFQRKA